MTPTPVGMRCPECARERTNVKTVRSGSSAPVVTQALIAINVIVFLAETATGAPLGGGGGGTVWNHGILAGPYITMVHEYYRILTAGFLHDGILHILFNMVFLYFMGIILEPAIGSVNFAFVYFASLLAGSFGALLFEPGIGSVGASGACFGVLGALMVVARYRRISIWQSGLGITLLINVVFSLTYTDISLGAHVGGFVGGVIAGWAIVELGERRGMPVAARAACVVVGAVGVALAIAVAGQHGLTPNGLTI
jgi:membrane associated rhomboid family serine protease